MDKADYHTEDWYIIFKKTTLKHWVFKWLDPEIQHCYAVKESPGGEFWMIVDSKNCHLDVSMVSKLDYPHIRALEPDSVILSIKAIIRPENYRHTLCVFNCVEVCKSVLGIRSFWTWTPYQLYRYLYGRRDNEIL
jgi:hypothetical protein